MRSCSEVGTPLLHFCDIAVPDKNSQNEVTCLFGVSTAKAQVLRNADGRNCTLFEAGKVTNKSVWASGHGGGQEVKFMPRILRVVGWEKPRGDSLERSIADKPVEKR